MVCDSGLVGSSTPHETKLLVLTACRGPGLCYGASIDVDVEMGQVGLSVSSESCVWVSGSHVLILILLCTIAAFGSPAGAYHRSGTAPMFLQRGALPVSALNQLPVARSVTSTVPIGICTRISETYPTLYFTDGGQGRRSGRCEIESDLWPCGCAQYCSCSGKSPPVSYTPSQMDALPRITCRSSQLTTFNGQANASFVSQVILERPANWDHVAIQRVQVRLPEGFLR